MVSITKDTLPSTSLQEARTSTPDTCWHTKTDFRAVLKQPSQNMQIPTDVSDIEVSRKPATTFQTSVRKHQEYKIFASRRAKFAKQYQLKTSKYKCQPCVSSVLQREGIRKSERISSNPSHLRESKSEHIVGLLEHQFEPETAKTKLKSLWNNIIYGWTLQSKSSFTHDSPLFMLGKCYHRRKEDESTTSEDDFLSDFSSRLWLTYRSNFYPIPGTKLNTDCGWGCMLRSGQMLIAQSLVTHFLGRDWRLHQKQSNTDTIFYREIIKWFSDPLDTPSDKSPFCLHHLANYGRRYNKYPGDWYGPASVALMFRDAFLNASHSVPIFSQMCLYVAQDCIIYIKDVINMCTRSHPVGQRDAPSESETDTSETEHRNTKWLRSLILLIPMRLGADVTNEIYFPCMKSLLSHDNCMGIIGGRPRHSLYFVGWQDNKLLYLDPHLCRETVDTTIADFKTETFHCKTPRKLAMSKMDPSCTVGFYIKDADDFHTFVQEVKEFISPPKQKNIYPLFTFSEGHHCDPNPGQDPTASDRRLRVKHYSVDEYGQRTFTGESEEFVVL